MIRELSLRMGNYFVKLKLFSNEMKSLYQYGFKLFISNCINIFIAMLIGILWNQVSGTILYLLAFAGVRSYAGGYHASSYSKCILLSNGSLLLLLLFRPGYEIPPMVLCAGMIMCSFIISFLAPVENRHNILDDSTRKKCKKTTVTRIWCLCTLFILAGILLPNLWNRLYPAVIVPYVIMFTLITGLIKNKIACFSRQY